MKREARQLDIDTVGDGSFWVILDATDCPIVPRKLYNDQDVKSVSLYKGQAEEAYWDIAPYLVQLDTPLFIWLQDTIWAEPWGIAFKSEASLEDLRKHFRKFLIVKNIEGEQLYFRFYDPRVLKSFLPTCKEKELEDFFGPIEEFWAKDNDEDTFQVFRR